MYTVSQLRRAIGSPALFGREINRLYHRRGYLRPYYTRGVDVVEADWDTLILLDACRYDAFAANHDLPGTLEVRESRASNTEEFLRANFGGRALHDTVYVTGNPQLHRKRDRVDAEFHAEVNVWQDDGWDEEYRTVLPETMADYALEAAERYPRKRLFVHFVQPHYPFIVPDTEFDKLKLHDSDAAGPDFWQQTMLGRMDLDPPEVWELYVENLRAALPHVEELLSSLEGRTVVSSDHGNMFGERSSPVPIREWGHPDGVYVDELVRVPWLVHENGPRREIEVGDTGRAYRDVPDERVQDRLRDLGYAE